MRYVLCPGWVKSKSDGDLHYITAPRLAQLYGVRVNDCAVWDSEKPQPGGRPEGIYLYPDYHGDYRLPNA